MAAPNLISPTTITGKTTFVALSTTSATSVLSNAAASNKVLKVNSIIAANVDGANSAAITLAVYSAAALGGTPYRTAFTITVPADASIVLVDKTTPIYLEENMSIGATASVANDIEIVCSYEDIS
jgi:hypothetical protein